MSARTSGRQRLPNLLSRGSTLLSYTHSPALRAPVLIQRSPWGSRPRLYALARSRGLVCMINLVAPALLLFVILPQFVFSQSPARPSESPIKTVYIVPTSHYDFGFV